METWRGKMKRKKRKGDDVKPVRNTSMRPRREITGDILDSRKGVRDGGGNSNGR